MEGPEGQAMSIAPELLYSWHEWSWQGSFNQLGQRGVGSLVYQLHSKANSNTIT